MSLQTSPILTSNPVDEAAILAVMQQMIDAWKRGDGAAYAAVFTEDADYIALMVHTSKDVRRLLLPISNFLIRS
ncbi:SgcJ/EcaC family oxidoreductase [Chlorogloeopsis sp. ULAP01]|uniref:SgcJ/EcaC family oxidoreductase n=1 Tax=Chlorogloeopsis sp. ULAP01 TaxID=3056483 RepID=UPI0025AB0578|nr:SgcJ/EcaC family oxidoreductase [Chlorogloeopsis sp. ULAP01]MDM9382588.1 SgcJ/EcaC family oxidoreductase [Chlorogloeopsis sp. ULAP01]